LQLNTATSKLQQEPPTTKYNIEKRFWHKIVHFLLFQSIADRVFYNPKIIHGITSTDKQIYFILIPFRLLSLKEDPEKTLLLGNIKAFIFITINKKGLFSILGG